MLLRLGAEGFDSLVVELDAVAAAEVHDILGAQAPGRVRDCGDATGLTSSWNTVNAISLK